MRPHGSGRAVGVYSHSLDDPDPRQTMADRERTDDSLTKSDLIEILAEDQAHLAHKDVELAVKSILEKMSQELASGERIEIRGFGSFSLHFRGARMGRNPKSGDAVALRGKHVPHFKPGKELRERVNASLAAHVPLTGDGSDEVPDDMDDGDDGDEELADLEVIEPAVRARGGAPASGARSGGDRGALD